MLMVWQLGQMYEGQQACIYFIFLSFGHFYKILSDQYQKMNFVCGPFDIFELNIDQRKYL